MIFKKISILNASYEIQNDMYVGTIGDTIAYISSEAPADDYGEVYEGKGKLLMP